MTAGTSTPVNMIRADLRSQALHRWAGSKRLTVRNAFDPGFAIHTLLVESFGDLAPRPFRFIIPRDHHLPGVFYGYSPHNADTLRNAAVIFADPLQSDVLPPASIQSKTMPTPWTTGQRLGFEVLIRPHRSTLPWRHPTQLGNRRVPKRSLSVSPRKNGRVPEKQSTVTG